MGFATVIKNQSYMTRMMKLSMKLYRKGQVQKKKKKKKKKKEKLVNQIVNIYLDVIYCHCFKLHVFFLKKNFYEKFL